MENQSCGHQLIDEGLLTEANGQYLLTGAGKQLVRKEIQEAKALLTEPNTDRLDKLFTYFDHFDIQDRYEIDFKTFCRKVDNRTWEAHLAL